MSAFAAMVPEPQYESSFSKRVRWIGNKESTPKPVLVEHPKWGRSTVLPLALGNCSHCHGSGSVLLGRSYASTGPCKCVLRAIFRLCWEQFARCTSQDRYMSRTSYEPHRGRARWGWGRKDEEFIADFELIARRELDDQHYGVFRLHFVLGADWKLCCPMLGIDRGTFFHSVYRVEERLGRAFREIEPYSLFPIDEYYHGPPKGVTASKAPEVPEERGALSAPLRNQQRA